MTFGGGDNSVQATDAPLTAEEVKYAVMIDAGSSGSRVYIYQWPTSDADTIYRDIRSVTNAAGDPQVLKIEPGLSSYRDHPQAAVDAFRPLISFASKNIPREKHHETPLYVLATAGMRMLREADRKQIFESVREGRFHSLFFVHMSGLFHLHMCLSTANMFDFLFIPCKIFSMSHAECPILQKAATHNNPHDFSLMSHAFQLLVIHGLK